MNKRNRWEIWQNGECLASGEAPSADMMRSEAMRYALQYIEDGSVEIRFKPERKPKRKKVKAEKAVEVWARWQSGCGGMMSAGRINPIKNRKAKR